MVMSDKALVKHLQKELARLESELRNPGPALTSDNSAAALLREKDLQIAKVKILTITYQRKNRSFWIESTPTGVNMNLAARGTLLLIVKGCILMYLKKCFYSNDIPNDSFTLYLDSHMG